MILRLNFGGTSVKNNSIITVVMIVLQCYLFFVVIVGHYRLFVRFYEGKAMGRQLCYSMP